jgi:hypothetical protein
MRIGQNGPHEKFTFMRLNIACIANVWRDNNNIIYVIQIYATAA